jgi:hypothetical protein
LQRGHTALFVNLPGTNVTRAEVVQLLNDYPIADLGDAIIIDRHAIIKS